MRVTSSFRAVTPLERSARWWQPDPSGIDRIVVVGASLAGVHAAEALREAGFDRSLTVLGAEPHLPYDRPPLVQACVGERQTSFGLRPPQWYADRGVTLLLDRLAVGLDGANRYVTLSDGSRVEYDGLVIATGSQPKTLDTGAEHIVTLRRLEEAEALRDRLATVRHVAVIGAGCLGLELAAAFSHRGCSVTIVEIAPAPLARVLGDEVGTWFRELHERHGVAVRCETLAVAVERAGSRYRLHLHDGDVIEADLVVGALGASPAVEWLEGSGLLLADGIVCDERLRTNLPGVVAAGDVARWYNPLFDEVMRVEQWTNAVEQGRHAGLSLLGAEDSYQSVPYLWSDQFEARMRFVGVSHAAGDVRIEHVSGECLVAAYVRDGVQVGGLCVNAASHLARHRAMIQRRSPLTAP
ncbi:NAD(P)/FAD-dependent oxidoreductase [Streptomyces olindensis]|uniref:NAD(P)/FAD-dependent oxidoreductase n=1 Tax=Streptomyces olindensis TaxID=358823 RepID=UPI0036A3CF50